ITKAFLEGRDVNIYESSDRPFIDNLNNQLSSLGYSVNNFEEAEDFNLELDPQNGRYYVISEESPKISVSLAPLAIKNNYWVLIINEENIDEVANRLSGANSVVGIGEFRRDFLSEIEQYFDERINNNNPFEDSIEIAKKYTVDKNAILSNGLFLEEDFFVGTSPVLLTGSNKMADSVYKFFEEEGVKTVTLIGNELTVVGEQIRERSDKEISVFIKYGQGATTQEGVVYALTEFPLPGAMLALTITQAIYDPDTEKLVVYFKNLGNTGLYELTSLSVKTDDEEIGSASDSEVTYIGAGETLPVEYDISLPTEKITTETIVEYYTSFGIYPSELDYFLTLEDEYGPPFNTPLKVQRLGEDPSSLQIIDAVYYRNLKRIGVTILNDGNNDVYYSVTIQDLIVHGLKENLFKEDTISTGEEKITYISVELDEVDLQENEVFNIMIRYGKDANSKFNSLTEELPFKVEAGSPLTGFAVLGGEGSGTLIIVVIVIVVILGVGYFLIKRRR
ncbi:MAG: hypothetical protein JSW73_02600, partial [Candidatus Woesearchaeota archaeon]